jgi:serine/threonine protein kinase
MPVWLGRPSEEVSLRESRILLTDFGVAFKPSEECRTSYPIPLMLTPPEKQFLPDKPVSFPSDIWSLACTIWSIITPGDLFAAYWENLLIYDYTEVLGKLPTEWWERWHGRTEWFDENGNIKDEDEPPKTLADRLEEYIQKPRERVGMETMGHEEKEAFLCLLRSMLKYLPSERISADEVLESEWMRRWAIPELDRAGTGGDSDTDNSGLDIERRP